MDNKVTFTHLLHAVRSLIAANAVFLGLMSLFRAVFFLYYSGGMDLTGLRGYLLEAFVLGARFDLRLMAYLNIPVILALLLVWALRKKAFFTLWAKAIPYCYFLLCTTAFVIMTVDFGFYSYFKDHINVLIFGFFEDDTAALVRTIASNHRFIPAALVLVLLAALIFAVSRAAGKTILKEPVVRRSYPLWLKICFVAVLVCANALAARGGLRMFPLGAIYAEISPDPFINKLSINGVFALFDALEARSENRKGNFDLMERFGYGGNEKKAFAEYLNVPEEKLAGGDLLDNFRRRTPKNEAAARLRPNVVVIVMESFGSSLLRYDSKDFDLLGRFRPHFESGIVFRNFMPAGLITIHALETLVLNIPQRPYDLSVTQSQYAFVPFPTRATLPFRNAGYRSVFLYGGSLGWRQLDSFMPAQGFDEALGEGSLPRDAGRNEWGAYDEYLFDALYGALSKGTGAPKFILAMTTGNHPPYSVPPSYKPYSLKIPDALAKVMTTDRTLAMKRFTTYQYANDMLGAFIDKVKNSPLGENTIIAVTGDHNFWDVFNYGSEDLFYRYGVPLYLYIPGALRPKSVNTGVCGSHVDIMPTLYALALPDTEYLALGRNLLDGDARAPGINSEGLAISGDGAVYHRFDTGSDERYVWDRAVKGRLVPAEGEKSLDGLSSFYRSSFVLSEYVIKNAGAGRSRRH